MNKLEIDGLKIVQYKMLISPDRWIRNEQHMLTNKKISWKIWILTYIPSRIANIFNRLGHVLFHFKWETDHSLLKHIIVHIKKGKVFKTNEQYKVVYKIFCDLTAKVGNKHPSEREALRKLKPKNEMKAAKQIRTKQKLANQTTTTGNTTLSTPQTPGQTQGQTQGQPQTPAQTNTPGEKK